MPIIKQELENSLKYNSAWCYCAKKEDTGETIAAAIYQAFDLPLAGIPSALISYILVRPDMRKKGIATKLQKFACRNLMKEGIKWVGGNTTLQNVPSINQIKNLKRKPWVMTVRIKQEENQPDN